MEDDEDELDELDEGEEREEDEAEEERSPHGCQNRQPTSLTGEAQSTNVASSPRRPAGCPSSRRVWGYQNLRKCHLRAGVPAGGDEGTTVAATRRRGAALT